MEKYSKLYDDLIANIMDELNGDNKYWATKDEWFKIIGGIIALYAGLATLGVWIQSIFLPFEELDKDVFEIFFMFAMVFSGLFILLLFCALFYFSNITAKKIASNNIKLVHVINAFKANSTCLTEQIATSKDVAILSEKMTKNLKQAPIQNLISWAYSLEIEKRCLDVYSFTYSLSWLTKLRIEEIIEELYTHRSHTYTYIYFPTTKSNQKKEQITEFIEAGIRTARANKTEITDEATNDVRKRLKILKYNNSNLPLPGDLSLYDQFDLLEGKRSCIVIPIANSVENDIPRKEYENYFDAKFEDVGKNKEKINGVRQWFKNTVKELDKNDTSK